MIQPKKHPGKVFLTVEDVKDHLRDYRIFDARYNLKIPNYGELKYNESHIQRAVRVDVDGNLCGPLVGAHARHPLPDDEVFVAWCKAQGISPEKKVLCYDDESGSMGACRLWWMLDALGVEAYVLTGGFQAYCAAGLPCDSGKKGSTVTAVSTWPYRTNFQRHIPEHEIPPNATLVDARAADRFATTVRPYGADTLPGHIDGALNLPFTALFVEKDGTKYLRDGPELRAVILSAVGKTGSQESDDLSDLVFYCGSGITACAALAAVRHAGLGHPYLYCGSWSEYAGKHSVPIIRHIVHTHGFWLRMLTPNYGNNDKFSLATCVVILNDNCCHELSEELRQVARHLHIGEKARVYYMSGETATVEIKQKNIA